MPDDRKVASPKTGTHYFPPGPVAKAFLRSDAFVAGIRGPIGSGKSTAAVMKLIRNAQKQKPGRDGWRRRRTAIIRNTYPELKTTTIKTWHQWIPANVGTWRETGPPTHHIIDEGAKLDWEVMFVALDRPDDVRKLLSMELSDAWGNEARELPKAIIDGLTGRVGRFPPTDGEFGCTDPQIILDTNPPDADHWWYVLAEHDQSTQRNRDMHDEVLQIQDQLRSIGALRKDQLLFEWFAQPGGESEGAENLSHLPPGYYLKAKAGKDAEWVKVYVRGEYGFVLDGRPVYPEYRDSVHCKEFQANRSLLLHIGMDFGLTPAALFCQQAANGQWRKHSEVVTERAGVKGFANLVKAHIAQNYQGFRIGSITGDPSGSAGQAGDEDIANVFQILEANGLKAFPASTNSPTLRIEAVRDSMIRLIDGEPGLLVHPKCAYLRKGYAGGYNYKRIQVTGDAKYRDVPDKNIYSHICDADQYAAIGAGEGKVLVKREAPANRESFAVDDYEILG